MTVIPLPSGYPEGSAQRVAAEVRALKGRYNATQTQLAEVLGVAQPAVSKKLKGATPFTLTEIDRLARFFGVHPAELLGGHGPGHGPTPPDSPKAPSGGRVSGSMDTCGYLYPKAA